MLFPADAILRILAGAEEWAGPVVVMGQEDAIFEKFIRRIRLCKWVEMLLLMLRSSRGA